MIKFFTNRVKTVNPPKTLIFSLKKEFSKEKKKVLAKKNRKEESHCSSVTYEKLKKKKKNEREREANGNDDDDADAESSFLFS